MPWGLHVTWELFSCSPEGKHAASLHLFSLSYTQGSRQPHPGWCFFWAIWASLLLRQSRFCFQSQMTAATGRSRRRSRARRHLRAGFPAPVLFLALLPQQPLPKPSRQQGHEHLVPLCGGNHPLGLCAKLGMLAHSQHWFRPIHRHFRGKSSLMFSGMFLWRLCFSAPPLSACFFEHIWFFLTLIEFFATQQPYLPKGLKHRQSGCVVFSWSQLWDAPASAHLRSLYEASVWAQPRGEEKMGGDE